MESDVKSVRGRRSTYRQEQAAATRQRIADVARRRFVRDGYGATTMATIAADAGVADRTVYAVFGAKREILSAICEQWLEEARVRPLLEAALAEPDPPVRMRHAAHWLRALYEHGFDVVQLFEAASIEDVATRAMLRAKLAGRNEVQDMLISSFGEQLVLPTGVCQAIFRAMAAPGLYLELVVESGWTADEFEDWVAASLSRQLLGVEPSPRASQADATERPGDRTVGGASG